MSHRIESIVIALRNLGGQARTPEIASEIRRIFSGPHPRALLDSIRGRLQECSSDSKHFRGKHNLFYRVNGIGGGIWGLREMRSPLVPEAEGPVDEAERQIEEPDFDEIIDRLEKGVRPAYGNSLERQSREKLLADTARLQEEVTRLQPPHGGMGHNQPPSDLREATVDSAIIAASFQEAATIEAEISKESPDSLKIARSAQRLQRFGRWLAGKADTFVEEFALAFGESLGRSAGVAITVGGLVIAMSHVIRSAANWLQLVLPGF